MGRAAKALPRWQVGAPSLPARYHDVRWANVGKLRDLLSASDPKPLPESVDSFLRSAEERGAACVCKGTRLLIECLTPQIADTLAQDSRIAAFSQRIGDRGLIIPVDKENAFRQAINSLNLGMPQI